MKRLFKTVKGRVIIMMVSFTVAVSVLVTAFSYYLIYAYQRGTTVQAAETNLQLIAGLIQQDVATLTSLATRAGQAEAVLEYFTAEEYDPKLATAAYSYLQQEYDNSGSTLKGYIHRLIVVNEEQDRVLQVSGTLSGYRALNLYTLDLFGDAIQAGTLSEWEGAVADPLAYNESLVLPYVTPVVNYAIRYGRGRAYYSGNANEIGTVYLAVYPALITEKLENYSLEGSTVYVSFGQNTYSFEGGTLHPAQDAYEILAYDESLAIGRDTQVASVRTESGEKGTLVSYPVQEGILLTQVLGSHQYNPLQASWIWILAGIVVLIIALALFILVSLDRHISRPVARLRKKIDGIAAGDFSADPMLESDSELGEVGRGVNRLSHEVVELMETRIADEKHKQELEYRMLQSQINPHFVYNTLNSIKWMATLQSAEGIAEMTTALSRLLKTVAKDIRKVVPLGEELSLLDDYFLIQQYRYGGAVQLTRSIESDALLEAAVPRFALQPLVENAIFHGIEPKGAGHITLDVRREGADVLVAITDDGVGIPAGHIQQILAETGQDEAGADSRHLGVQSVHQRIRHVFGEGYGLAIESREGEYTTMTLRVPGPAGINGPEAEEEAP